MFAQTYVPTHGGLMITIRIHRSQMTRGFARGDR